MAGVALVTGGSRGIGAATAVRLAADHDVVVLTYARSAAAAAAVVDAIGPAACAIEADLRDPSAGPELVDEVVDRFGRLDAVVNNAGVADRRPFLDLDLDTWQEALDVNLTSAFLVLQAAARAMVAVGEGGAIVNVGSPAATDGGSTGAHYAASKAGLLGLTAHAAKALAPHGIRVNLVEPMAIDTEMMRAAAGAGSGGVVVPPSPMGRLGTPAEAAELIAFLCSPAASFVSGQRIAISGAA